jgi:type III secretory pathway component EscU
MKKWFGILVLILIFSLDGSAQCAMCKAVAETSTEAGSSVATGLNSGIMYLMAFPYLLLGVIGYAFYRHKKAQTRHSESQP